MKKRARARDSYISAKLCREHPCDMRHFNRVLEYILAEARAEMETSQKRGELRVKPDNAGLICRRFALLLHYFRHLGARLLHRLFYLGRLDATIGDELFERNLRDSAAQGVKKRRVLFCPASHQ